MMHERPGKLSCGAVVVRDSDAGWQTLMLRAYRNWDFPKGLCESGETPKDAAIREVGEETGIEDLGFDWGDRFTETGPYNQGKVARYFLARTEQEEVQMGVSEESLGEGPEGVAGLDDVHLGSFGQRAGGGPGGPVIPFEVQITGRRLRPDRRQ